jgi:hypothetical protein
MVASVRVEFILVSSESCVLDRLCANRSLAIEESIVQCSFVMAAYRDPRFTLLASREPCRTLPHCPKMLSVFANCGETSFFASICYTTLLLFGAVLTPVLQTTD